MQITRNIRPVAVEERGNITRVVDSPSPIRSVLLITSKAGSVRSNHYHQKDTHYCYIISGKAEWHEKPVAGGKTETAVLSAGDMVFTPPMVVHAVKFLEDTVFLAFATESREQTDYEADTIRVKLI
ncbi:MAG: cupin domain-containing protein [Patescibacteria group bacterium]|nr:cupin domain-containing protein [Patescibacteria group bacterium]